MSFSNLYYKRAVGTAKACYVCYKPTTTVLATVNTVDFLYTCSTHLTDSGFATQVKDETQPAAVSAEDIAKVKAEWEAKQKKKEKEKEKAKEDKDKTDEKQKKEESKPSVPPSAESGASSKASTPKPTHERYILHRDFFAMRQGEHRKRRQTAQAKELAPRLPGAPTGGL